ncbi:MAG: ZIP family metal transporter [Clostridia bacterium]|nr:ZIP family metal transporter [Clostridia bacterium]
MFEWVIAVTAIAGVGGTGIGGGIALFLKHDSSRVVSLLLSFAGGIMIGVVCFDMIPSAINPDGTSLPINIFFVIFCILVGYIVVWLLNLWIDKATNHELEHIDECHPKTADDLDELIHSDHYVRHEKYSEDGGPSSPSQLLIAGIVMACAIALHNVPEGMVIGAAYAKTSTTGIFSGSGLIMAIIIGLHNIPEGMAVAVPLICGGTSKTKALFITAISGAPTILGAILGYCLGTLSPIWLSFSLSFASGAMLYVVFGELLPEAILMWRSKLPSLAAVMGVLLGLLLIYI